MSLFKTFVTIPEYKLDNETACGLIDSATLEAEYVFGMKGASYETKQDYKEGDTVLHFPFTLHRPKNGKRLAIRIYPGCYLVARSVETKPTGVEVCLESYYSIKHSVDRALPKALPKGTKLLVAELDDFELDLIDEPIIRLWEYFQYTIICVTARYRKQYRDREDDLMAEAYTYFMKAVRRVQQGLATRDNVPAFIASYIRDSSNNLLYTDWCVRPTRVKDTETGKESLKGHVATNSLDIKADDDTAESTGDHYMNIVSFDATSEKVPEYETILYNFRQVSSDPADNTIMEMLTLRHTYEEIGNELGITRAAVQQRIARIRRDHTASITNIPADISPTQAEMEIVIERSSRSATITAVNCKAWDSARLHIAHFLSVKLPTLTDKEKREQKMLDPRIHLPLPVADRLFTPDERSHFNKGICVKILSYSELLTIIHRGPQ